MSTQKQSKIRQVFKEHEKQLNELFRKYCDPLPGTPDDEYDCLTHQILSYLQNGKKQSDITLLISREFNEHFGISVPSTKIESVTKEILKWWSKTANAA
jgi:hypothetical protein